MAELTEREEELRLAIATAYLEKVGSTILYDHGSYLIEILEQNATLVIGVIWEYRNRKLQEEGRLIARLDPDA
jgi:hypothetical protein